MAGLAAISRYPVQQSRWEIAMMMRIVRSLLVGIAAGSLGLVLSLVCLQLYVTYVVPHPPGLGAYAGGFMRALPIAMLLFLLGFVWNWRRTA
jgi:hypothetical protein